MWCEYNKKKKKKLTNKNILTRTCLKKKKKKSLSCDNNKYKYAIRYRIYTVIIIIIYRPNCVQSLCGMSTSALRVRLIITYMSVARYLASAGHYYTVHTRIVKKYYILKYFSDEILMV